MMDDQGGAGLRGRDPAGRPRELFPLPHVNTAREKLAPSARGSRQRASQAARVNERVNELIDGLNYLYGAGPAADGRMPSLAQEGVLDYLHRVVQQRAPPPEGCAAPQEALRELLRSSAVYGGGGTLAAYREGLVSLPDDVTGAPNAADILDTGDREMLMGFEERVMMTPAERKEVLADEGPSLGTSIRR